MLPALLLFGCRATIDHFVSHRVVDRATDVPDVGEACATGAALANAMRSLTRADNEAHEALLVAEVTGALCSEVDAREADLAAIRAQLNAAPEGRAAEIRDATIHGQRAHGEAAGRFYRAYQQLEARWGTAGAEKDGAISCPQLNEDDAVVYTFGLFAGLNALLHDKASDNLVGVPADIPSRVARAATCLDNDALWHVPGALQAAAWAAVPGSGPPDVDPWQKLAGEADAGSRSGVRLAYAVLNRMAGNSGRDDLLVEGLAHQAKSRVEIATDPDWALFDRYAEIVSLHEADLYWTRTRGYRARSLDEVPGSTPTETTAPAAFGTDDPFANPPAKEEPHAP
jgi:hypothetical protein